MPTFKFNRLVRDKLPADYKRLGQQATYKKLSRRELLEALRDKIIEELKEIDFDASLEDIEKELADTEQADDDLRAALGVDSERIAAMKAAKLEKKGGFLGGYFVQTLTLADDDEWVDYYRSCRTRSPQRAMIIVGINKYALAESSMFEPQF